MKREKLAIQVNKIIDIQNCSLSLCAIDEIQYIRLYISNLSVVAWNDRNLEMRPVIIKGHLSIHHLVNLLQACIQSVCFNRLQSLSHLIPALTNIPIDILNDTQGQMAFMLYYLCTPAWEGELIGKTTKSTSILSESFFRVFPHLLLMFSVCL